MTTAHTTTWTTPELAALAESSLALIVGLQEESGAYPASPTFSAYEGFSWFRDGAFIADGVSAYGEVESASRFHDWCARVLAGRSEQIDRIVAAAAAGTPVGGDDMLPARYTFAGEPSNDEWWDFQLDGYGTWLWAVVEHDRRHGVGLARWRSAMGRAVDYLVSSWRRPCFDWWEEHSEAVHVSTLGCIAAGLLAASASGALDAVRTARAQAEVREIIALIESEGVVDGHLIKWIGSSEVDGSLVALVHPLDLFPATGPIGAATIAAVDSQLSVGGGVHRFLADTFYGGGQWPLLSCFLGLGFAAAGNRDAALEQLRWAARTTTEAGHMPEQVTNHLLDPTMEAEWIERWGTVATPLLWSHAMYLRLAAELGIGARA